MPKARQPAIGPLRFFGNAHGMCASRLSRRWRHHSWRLYLRPIHSMALLGLSLDGEVVVPRHRCSGMRFSARPADDRSRLARPRTMRPRVPLDDQSFSFIKKTTVKCSGTCSSSCTWNP